MKKSIIIITLASILALGLIGCQSSVKNSENNQPQKTATNENSKTQENTKTDKAPNTNTNVKTDTNSTTPKQKGTKQEYKAKLDKIQSGLKDLAGINGTTIEMGDCVRENYEKWDAALNEIYGVLKGQLSDSDMAKLKTEEQQWIKKRDAKADKDASEMEGGSMEGILRVESLGNSTKARCYELVDKYMK